MNALTSPDTAAQCLVAAAEYCEALEAVVEMAPGVWFVHFETGGECLVEWADEPRRLVVTAGVGEPTAQARASIHASCLTFNALWSSLGAMRLANDLVCEGENLPVQLANNLLRHEGLRLFWSMVIDSATDGQSVSQSMDLLSAQRA